MAVLRIAGPDADGVLRALGATSLPTAREVRLVRLSDPQDGQPIDQALVLRFPGPASFTGDDVIEIHHHGGLGIRRMLASILMRAPGLRPAEPGEFTRRAFVNGKLDLSEVVGLGDLIDATTARAARSALLRLEGGLSRKVADWSERLLDVRARIEAEIDFSADQSDVTAGATAGALPALSKIQSELAAAWAQGPTASRLRDGFRVAVIGAPNVGKSSLVNLLAGRDVAIVTDRPGTTRDAIEVDLDLDGLPVTLIDTAGLRETEDPIEREGIQRARDKAAGADLVLELVDGSRRDPLPPGRERHLVVVNKSDLCPTPFGGVNISCRTGDGISTLLQTVARVLNAELSEEAGAVPTDAHGQAAIGEALGAVDRALEAIGLREPVLVADELRQAATVLSRITGTAADPEDVLGAIFARFCIGK